MLSELLTARNVADRLGYSAETILRWNREGKGPPAIVLPNGALRFRLEDFEAWLDERRTAPGRGVSPTSRSAVAWPR